MGVQSLLHDATPVPSGYGVREEQVHTGSGLRIRTVSATLSRSDVTCSAFTLGTPVAPGAADVATMNAGTWFSLRPPDPFWNGRLPIPMTPSIVAAIFPVLAATTFKFQYRVTGLDQFGNAIQETTPLFDLAGVDGLTGTESLYWVVCSKVFSYVSNIEVRGADIGAAVTPKFAMGYSFLIDPTSIETASVSLDYLTTGLPSKFNMLGTHQNWGIGTPLRVSPYANDPIAPIAATGTLTSTGVNPAAADTVTLDGIVYTWRASLTAGVTGEVLIGASAAASLQNLFDAVNRTGTPGTQYSAALQQHPTIRSSGLTATTVVFAARVPGSGGNTLTTTESGAQTSFGAATLTGGTDSGYSRFPEILGASGILLRQSTTPTVLNIAGRIRTFGTAGVATGCVLGQSAPIANNAVGNGITYSSDPWQGCSHKWGFRTSDAWATAPFEMNGSSQRVSNLPTANAQIMEDEFFFTFTVRSSLGTQRDTTAAPGYPR